jgi:hypothetical protein
LVVTETIFKEPLNKSLKRRWLRCKETKNAHLLRVNCAFSFLCASPSSA